MNPIPITEPFDSFIRPFLESPIPTVGAPELPGEDFGGPEDRDLTRRIVVFLGSRGLLHGASLALKVNSGHIELRGTVATFRQRERVESFVRRVAGVHGVTNQLVVGTLPLDTTRDRPHFAARFRPVNLAHSFHD